MPPPFYTFPSVYMNGYYRSFQPAWMKTYPWLVYSTTLDGVFCLPCSLFAKERQKKGALVNSPFTRWVKSADIFGGKNGHVTKLYHDDAMQAMYSFTTSMKNPKATLPVQLNQAMLQQIKDNRHIAGRISEAILFCGRQCIALRGHSENLSKEGNHGNFLAFLMEVAKYDPLLEKHLQPLRRNVSYLSPRSQNELIEVIGNRQIRAHILNEVREAKFFAVMADEVTSHNREHMALCVRFVDAANNIREEFLEFISLQRTTGEEIAKAIKKALSTYQLPIQDLRGQGYDGAPSMSSSRVGVQARLREEAPLATYTHCAGHCLNLVISHSCALAVIRNMNDKLKETCLLFNTSPKREALLKEVISKDEPDTTKKKPLLNLCKTRWAERQHAYDHFYDFYKHLITTLEIIGHGLHLNQGYQDNLVGSWDPDTRKRASSLLNALTDFSFIMTFVTVHQALSHLHGITVKLQSRSMDIIKAHSMVCKLFNFI